MFRPLIPHLPPRAQLPALIVLVMLRVLLVLILIWFVVYAYQTRRELELLTIELETQRKTDAAIAKTVQEQLDTFYRTLYTDPDLKKEPPPKAPPPPRQPSVVELWQRNRDKELRDRIMRMERWRLDVERRINELR